MKSLLLKICWWLEDMADWVTHDHAKSFYPSKFFESSEELHAVDEKHYKEFDNVQDLIKELHGG